YVLAVPADRARALAPALGLDRLETSPITGIHLWFDQPVMDLPQAALLEGAVHWAFNKREGRYVELVVSASRDLLPLSREQLTALAVRELAAFFPAAGATRLERAHVVREVRATFSPQPGVEARRPATRTRLGNLFLAGDYTKSGWPATMESAVRSGYLAAEAVTAAFGAPQKFLIADPEP
ncbi:MAG: FAD-dependent oxidoreductase, partial [Bryobacteraceae bacterium]